MLRSALHSTTATLGARAIWLVAYAAEEALRRGVRPDEVHSQTKLGKWLGQLSALVKSALNSFFGRAAALSSLTP